LSPEQAVGGDREFERLYSSYAPNVFRYALTVLGQKADAEDVTQTTFMNAYRAYQRGERPQKPEQWLITIAHNTCLQRFRRDQRRPREVALHGELAVAAVEDDGAPTAQELRRAIEQLPPAQRSALVMRELEGRSYADMAATLRISVSALETLLFRARRTLREQLGEPLSCHDATAAITRQLEGRLPNDERRALRAHLRSCDACATHARSKRAQRQPLRGVLSLQFPSWVGRLIPAVSRVMGGASSSGGIGAAGIAMKAAAIIVAGTVVGGGVYEGATHVGPLRTHSTSTNASRGAMQATAPAMPTPSHGVSATLPAGPQSGGTAQNLPTPAVGQTNVSSVASPPPATGSSDASGAGTAVAAVAGTVNTGRQPAAETPAAQGADSLATTASSTQSDSPPVVPPGQAKKNAAGNSASGSAQGASNGTRVPPGQAKKDANGNANANVNANGNGNSNANANGNAASAAAQDASNGTKVPPGQAKKDAPAADSGNVSSSASSGSEASAAPAASAAATTPPGQAKKDAPPAPTSSTDTTTPADPAASVSTPPAANVPPGQAKKDANATAPIDPAPSDPASSTTTTPAPPKTPPGQAKRNP
jgi:RNA polymerase sigma factor (sigma-70 family)